MSPSDGPAGGASAAPPSAPPPCSARAASALAAAATRRFSSILAESSAIEGVPGMMSECPVGAADVPGKFMLAAAARFASQRVVGAPPMDPADPAGGGLGPFLGLAAALSLPATSSSSEAWSAVGPPARSHAERACASSSAAPSRSWLGLGLGLGLGVLLLRVRRPG